MGFGVYGLGFGVSGLGFRGLIQMYIHICICRDMKRDGFRTKGFQGFGAKGLKARHLGKDIQL